MDAQNYDNPWKKHWRKTVWNEIARRVPNRKDALVLYLPGSTDLDRPVATDSKRGFHDANLIAVDRDDTVATYLRKKGRTVINNDLVSVMYNWPEKHPVSVIFADLQCGMIPYVWELLEAYAENSAFDGTVLAINLMRGNPGGDSIGCFTKQDLQDAASLKQLLDVPASCNINRDFLVLKDLRPLAQKENSDDLRHRGFAVLSYITELVSYDLLAAIGWLFVLDERSEEFGKNGGGAGELKRRVEEIAWKDPVNPKRESLEKVWWLMQQPWNLNSWKEPGSPFYDEAKVQLFALADWINKKTTSTLIPGYRSTPRSPYFDCCVVQNHHFLKPHARVFDQTIRQQIIAALAVRTRRKGTVCTA